MNIYDIADQAGVSIATVSRVLNNPAAVSVKTREKVTAIMQAANFSPKLGVQAGRSKDLAFFTSTSSLPHESGIVAGIGEIAFAERLHLRLCALDQVPRKAADLAVYFAEEGIGGAIFSALPYSEAHYASVAATIPSVLLFNGLGEGGDVNYIRADQRKTGYMALQHLAAMNHRQIAMVDDFRSVHHRDRLDGAREAMAACGRDELGEEHVLNVSELSEMDMCAQIDYYLLRYPGTTALFVANDSFVPALYRHFRSKGKRIPDDLSIIGAEDVPVCAELYPPLTTVRQPLKAIGMKAARHMADILLGIAAPGRMQETIDVQLVVRASTRRLE